MKNKLHTKTLYDHVQKDNTSSEGLYFPLLENALFCTMLTFTKEANEIGAICHLIHLLQSIQDSLKDKW